MGWSTTTSAAGTSSIETHSNSPSACCAACATWVSSLKSRPLNIESVNSSQTRRSFSLAKVEYTAMLLGATGNVGGHILHLLVQSPLCKKVVVVTRRNVAELANPKLQQVVVNMDKLEEELAPHAKGVDIALAAFGVGKGSAKMADEDVRKIEITYPTAFASAAKAGGARVLAMMTAAGADSHSSTKYLRNIGDKEKKSEELEAGRRQQSTHLSLFPS